MSRFFKSKRRVTPHPLVLHQDHEKLFKDKKMDGWKTSDKKMTVSIKDKYDGPCGKEGEKYYRDAEFENSPGYCVAKAMLFLQDKQTTVALQYLNEAITMDPQYVKAYKERGRIYRSQGNLQLAREDYNIVLNIDTKDYVTYIFRGIAFEDEGQLDLAISDFTSAILLKSDEKLGYLHRGHAYFLSRRYQEATQDYNRVLLINPKDAVAYRNRGLTYRHQGNLDSALNDLNKSLELDPSNATAYLNRSVVVFMRGRIKERAELGNMFPGEAAAADFNKSLQLDPHTLTKALQTTTKLIKLYPSDFYHYLIRGVLHHLNGNHCSATEDHSKAYNLNPMLTLTHTKLTCCLNKHQGEEADTKNFMDTYWFYNEGGELTISNSEGGNSAKQKAIAIRRKSRFSVPDLIAERLVGSSGSSSGGGSLILVL